MRVLLAESGHELNIQATFENFKQEIENIIQIKPSNQILLTPSGTQLKDQNTLDENDTIILFNRRLLKQDPMVLLMQEQEEECKKLLLPSLKELETHLIRNDPTEYKNLIETILDTCHQRQAIIDKLTQEIVCQSLALNAALNNLQNHVSIAYQTFEKFDRIAQCEFAKDALSIAQIDLDIDLLLQIKPHPRLNTSTIDNAREQQQQFKDHLLHQYDILVTATLEQKNKVVYLNQQTTNVSVNRTTFEIIVGRVTKIRDQARLWIQSMEKDIEQEPLDKVKSLYSFESKIQEAETSILQEKQASVAGFVRCMHAVSQVEQSVSQIYPRLAELENKIKALRIDIEKGQGVVARKRITAHGVVLIELWRRDKYTEIVSKNASLLGDLFLDFGKKEEKYRKNFLFENESLLDSTVQQEILNDMPVICQTCLNMINPVDDTLVISKKQVKAYIQMVHSFYASNNTNMPRRSKSTEDQVDISYFLNRKLERETKRINRGLVQLGLPGSNNTMPASVLLDTKDVSTSPIIPVNGIDRSVLLSRKHDLEKASMLTQHQEDLVQFEIEKQALLRELALKDNEIKTIKSNYKEQIQSYQTRVHKVETACKIKKKDYDNKEKQFKARHDHAIQQSSVHEANLINEHQLAINDMQQQLDLSKNTLKEMQQKLGSTRLELVKSQQEAIQLQKEQASAKQIANDLVSIIADDHEEKDLTLTDLLRKVMFQLTTTRLNSYNNNSGNIMMIDV